jgi:prophage DNA circulation protein
VEDAGGNYGRRFADHQYPGRNRPYAEDLGRAQRVWPLTGYTIGPAFRLARDALLAACERKGSGELVHPALGIMLAVCRRVSFSEQREAGLRCVFSLEFAEPGELEEPGTEQNADMVIESAADALGVASAAAFLAVFSVSASLDYVADHAALDVRNFAALMEHSRLPAMGYPQAPCAEAIEQLYAEADGLVHHPPDLSQRTDAVFTTFSNAGEPAAVTGQMEKLANDYQSGTRAIDVRPRAVDPPGTRYPARTREARNQVAWQSYIREHALREIGYAITAVPIDSYEEARAIEQRIISAFEAAETAAADAGFDDVFISLVRLRSAVLTEIETRNQARVPTVIYRTQNTSNALVLAWQFYRDAARNIELQEAVQAINPAFMPRSGYVKAS